MTKGITFARRIGNKIEIVTIPNHPLQTFQYFFNPSKMSNAEREEKRKLEFEKALIEKLIKTGM
jgi:hypothetical protein